MECRGISLQRSVFTGVNKFGSVDFFGFKPGFYISLQNVKGGVYFGV
jgi:hypothetical protein